MGLAFPIALGVALAQPQRRVVGIEGDGASLRGCMSGSLSPGLQPIYGSEKSGTGSPSSLARAKTYGTEPSASSSSLKRRSL